MTTNGSDRPAGEVRTEDLAEVEAAVMARLEDLEQALAARDAENARLRTAHDATQARVDEITEVLSSMGTLCQAFSDACARLTAAS